MARLLVEPIGRPRKASHSEKDWKMNDLDRLTIVSVFGRDFPS